MNSVELRELPGAVVTEASTKKLKYKLTKANLSWMKFTDYCTVHGITGLKGLKDAPGWLEEMLADKARKK